MTASRLVVWRHGQTDWNLQGRWQGQTDIELNETGISQAIAAAPGVADYKPNEIWSSDLKRATRTAAELTELTGLGVRTDPRLREIFMGEWEGLTKAEILARYPEHAQPESLDKVRGGHGESLLQTAERVAEALEEIAEQASEGSVVAVVMHGAAARIGAFQLVGAPLHPAGWLGPLENCKWLVLDRDHDKGWRITAYNLGVDA